MSLTISEPMTTLVLGLVLVALSRAMRTLNGRATATTRPDSTR